MKIKELIHVRSKGFCRFNLSIGGFVVKNCRWFPRTGRIMFPIRYDTAGRPFKVVFAHGAQVKRLQRLLRSGKPSAPRDRRPCVLKPHFMGGSRQEWPRWVIFNFTVRGFTILGCRWQPSSGSIQLPVTFSPAMEIRPRQFGHLKKKVVCAYGAHINRLRKALEVALPVPSEAEAGSVSV